MPINNVIALDVGERRIGVASGDTRVRIPVARGFIAVDGKELGEVVSRAQDVRADVIVVGYPRNLSGNATAQTSYVEDFTSKLRQVTSLPIIYQDESLTSVAAEQNLKQLGKPYEKGDIDAEAARLILRDYLEAYVAS